MAYKKYIKSNELKIAVNKVSLFIWAQVTNIHIFFNIGGTKFDEIRFKSEIIH